MQILSAVSGLGLLIGAGKKLFGGGKQQQQQVLPPAEATRDDAAAMIEREGKLRRRKGSASDMLVNGSSGAEPTGAVGRLVVGS